MIIIIFPREVDNDDDNAGNHDDDDDDPRNIFKKWLIVMARSFYQKRKRISRPFEEYTICYTFYSFYAVDFQLLFFFCLNKSIKLNVKYKWMFTITTTTTTATITTTITM